MEVVTGDDIKVPIEERVVVETLVAVLMDFDVDFLFDYGVTVNVLLGI